MDSWVCLGYMMETDVWGRKFIVFSLSHTAMILWNPFEKVFTNYNIF